MITSFEPLYFQAKVGREKEFEYSLRKLRGDKANISAEADEIHVHYYLFSYTNGFLEAKLANGFAFFYIGNYTYSSKSS